MALPKNSTSSSRSWVRNLCNSKPFRGRIPNVRDNPAESIPTPQYNRTRSTSRGGGVGSVAATELASDSGDAAAGQREFPKFMRQHVPYCHRGGWRGANVRPGLRPDTMKLIRERRGPRSIRRPAGGEFGERNPIKRRPGGKKITRGCWGGRRGGAVV